LEKTTELKGKRRPDAKVSTFSLCKGKKLDREEERREVENNSYLTVNKVIRGV